MGAVSRFSILLGKSEKNDAADFLGNAIALLILAGVIIAAGAVGKLSIVFLSSIIGISVGSQPILGFNLGNKKYGRVKDTYLLALRYGTVVAASFLILQLFPSPLLNIFGSDDSLFFDFGVRYIRICLAMLFLKTIQPVLHRHFVRQRQWESKTWFLDNRDSPGDSADSAAADFTSVFKD